MRTYHVIRRSDLALGDRFETRERNWRSRLRLTEERERAFREAFNHSASTGGSLETYVNLLAWDSQGRDAGSCYDLLVEHGLGFLEAGEVASFLAAAGGHRITFATGDDALQLRECLFEAVRRETNPRAQSRLESCFSYAEIADARSYLSDCRGFQDRSRRNSVICELMAGENASQACYDRKLYDAFELTQPFAEARRHAAAYWAGERDPTPALECLTIGEVILRPL